MARAGSSETASWKRSQPQSRGAHRHGRPSLRSRFPSSDALRRQWLPATGHPRPEGVVTSVRALGSLRVATLGGPATFAGQATSAAFEKYQELGHVVYCPTMAEVWEAIDSRTADIGILGAETSSTGLTEIAERLLDDDSFSVLGEVVVPYNCMLLGKPGSSTEHIRLVVGHGSLRLCERSLRTLVPNAELRLHPQNSMAAALDVLKSDGSVAVVGTSRSKEEFGLEHPG